jgi:Mrp family chromosome partitioning ATPase
MVSKGAAREALQQVTGTGARVLGAVLNRTRFERHSYYYYSAYHRVRGQYQRQPGA